MILRDHVTKQSDRDHARSREAIMVLRRSINPVERLMPAAPAVPRKPLDEYRMEFQKVAVFYRASMPIKQAFCRDFGVQGKSAASKRRYQLYQLSTEVFGRCDLI
jgi:hypothetical protein